MKITQLSIDTLERAQERFLETLAMMTVEEANTLPAPKLKSVTWLIWHSARVLDYQISPLKGSKELYTAQGFQARFNLDPAVESKDYLHTDEQAKKVVVTDKQVIIDYLQATIDLAKDYLLSLDVANMSDIVDTNWTPHVTRQVRLVSTVDDIVMHSGQAVYSRRLVIGK